MTKVTEHYYLVSIQRTLSSDRVAPHRVVCHNFEAIEHFFEGDTDQLTIEKIPFYVYEKKDQYNYRAEEDYVCPRDKAAKVMDQAEKDYAYARSVQDKMMEGEAARKAEEAHRGPVLDHNNILNPFVDAGWAKQAVALKTPEEFKKIREADENALLDLRDDIDHYNALCRNKTSPEES